LSKIKTEKGTHFAPLPMCEHFARSRGGVVLCSSGAINAERASTLLTDLAYQRPPRGDQRLFDRRTNPHLISIEKYSIDSAMAKGGARPGAGRPRGPSKATIEKALIAERTVSEAKTAGKKLAKEVLEDFMLLFTGMAAGFQIAPPGASPNLQGDEGKFWKYAQAAVDCAHKLAPYQSPTFRAVVVAPGPKEKIMRIKLKIFDHDGREVNDGDGREMSELLPPAANLSASAFTQAVPSLSDGRRTAVAAKQRRG